MFCRNTTFTLIISHIFVKERLLSSVIIPGQGWGWPLQQGKAVPARSASSHLPQFLKVAYTYRNLQGTTQHFKNNLVITEQIIHD